jgi:hypothetical protein
MAANGFDGKGWVHRHDKGAAAHANQGHIADEVEVEIVEQGSIDCRRGIGPKKRVTVRRGTYDCLRGDIAGGSPRFSMTKG